jgi:hypothetical protein
LGDEAVVRVLGDAQEMSPSGGVLDSKEHVQPLEEHGANAEEVSGQDPLGLGFEELRPGRASPGCRPEAMTAKDAPDRCGTGPDAGLAQLALDA